MDRETIAKKIIGLAIEVHQQLGPGFPEKIYQRAFAIILGNNNIGFEQEKKFTVSFGGKMVGYQFLDFLVENELVVEVKALEKIVPIHISQVVSYLKATKKKLGIILTFYQEIRNYFKVVASAAPAQMTHPVDPTRSLKLSEWAIKKEIEKLRPLTIYKI